MAWTTPRTWVSGELVTASMLNTHIRDNMQHAQLTFGSSIDITFSAGNFTHNTGGGAWTVESGDVLGNWYYRFANRGRYTAIIVTSTLSGTTGPRLNIAFPALGTTFARSAPLAMGLALQGGGGVTAQSFAFARVGTSTIELFKADLTNWNNGTNNVAILFTMPFITDTP